MSDPKQPASMRRRRLLWVAAVASLATLAGFAALFLLTRSVEPEELARWLEPRIEAALGRDVSVGRARVDFWPPVAVALSDLEVGNPPNVPGPPLARVRELRLDLSVLRLLRRQVSVDEIRLDGPDVDVVVMDDGTTNLEGLGGEDGPDRDEAGGAPFQVDIESIRVVGGSITYRDPGKERALVVSPLQARFRVRTGEAGDWELEGVTEGRVAGRTGGESPVRLGPYAVRIEAVGDASSDLRTLRVTESSVEIEDLMLLLAAEWAGDGSSAGTFTARIKGDELDAARVLSLVPDSLADEIASLSGRVSVDVSYRAEVGSDEPAEALGLVSLAGIEVVRPEMGPVVTALGGDVNLTLDSLWTTNLEGEVAGGPARVRGLVRAGDEGGFVVRVSAQPDLGRAAALTTLPDSVTVSGDLSLDVTARGRLDDPANARLSGRAIPEGVRLTLPRMGVPISIPEGTVLLEGDVIRWSDLPVALGSDRFTTSGQVRDALAWLRDGGAVPVLDGDFVGERFDLDAVVPSPPPDSTVLYGRLLFARLGERNVDGKTPRQVLEERGLARPDSIPLSGTVAVAFGRFLSEPYELTDVRARIELQPSLIRVHDADAGAYGGRLRADLDVGLGAGADQPFSFRLDAIDVRAGDFLGATTPLGRFFGGTLSLDLDVSGDMDDVYLPTRASVLGSGAFSLREATIHATPVTEAVSRFFRMPELARLSFEDWSSPILVRDGRVVIRESALRGAFGEPRLAGAIGFGGQLALDLLFDLPTERVDSAALARMGVGADVFNRLASTGRPLEAALKIAGTVAAPLLTADQAAVGRRLAEAVEDEVENQVQREIDERRQELEDRAIEAVERVIPRGDSARPEPPGLRDLRRLLTPDILRRRQDPPPPDSAAAADTAAAPRDTTLARDTLRPDTTGAPRSPPR